MSLGSQVQRAENGVSFIARSSSLFSGLHRFSAVHFLEAFISGWVRNERIISWLTVPLCLSFPLLRLSVLGGHGPLGMSFILFSASDERDNEWSCSLVLPLPRCPLVSNHFSTHYRRLDLEKKNFALLHQYNHFALCCSSITTLH